MQHMTKCSLIPRFFHFVLFPSQLNENTTFKAKSFCFSDSTQELVMHTNLFSVCGVTGKIILNLQVCAHLCVNAGVYWGSSKGDAEQWNRWPGMTHSGVICVGQERRGAQQELQRLLGHWDLAKQQQFLAAQQPETLH